MFAVSVRGLYQVPTKNGWLLLNGFLFLHGWLVTAVNLIFYGNCYWLGFWVIKRTRGRERLFMIGWFGFLLSPLKALWPDWAALVRGLEFFGITVSLVASLSLVLYPWDVVRSDSTPDPGEP